MIRTPSEQARTYRLTGAALTLALAIFVPGASTMADDADDTGLSIEDDKGYQLKADVVTNQKVWGGVRVTAGAFPAIVGITRAGNKQIQCTGTLIEPDLVVTAAHCVCASVTGTVVFGEFERTPRTTVKVKAYTNALRACGGDLTDGADLGLLLLSSKSDVPPVEIQSDDVVQAAASYQVVGFGGFGVDNSGQLIAGEKRETVVPSATNDCMGNLPKSARSYASAFGCASGNEIVAGKAGLGRDTCDGDSGGPLLTDSSGKGIAFGQSGSALKIAGVTSRATKSAKVPCGDGGVYVRLNAAARNWITLASQKLRQ